MSVHNVYAFTFKDNTEIEFFKSVLLTFHKRCILTELRFSANLLESNNFSINTGASQSCNNPSVHNSIDGIMGNIGIKSGMVGTAPYSYVRGRTIIGGVDKTIGNPSVCKSVRSNFSTSDTLNSIGNAFQGNWTSWQSSSVFQPASNITPIIQNNTVTKQLSKDEINDLLS